VTVGAFSTRFGDGDSHAAPAPDAGPGRIVYFATGSGGEGSYLLADPLSHRSVYLSNSGVEMVGGALEPDGGSVLVPCAPGGLETSEDVAENLGICRIDLRSGARTLVVDAGYPVQHPSSAGGEVRSLCNGFCPLYRFFDIAWSPDGTQVAFVGSTPGSGAHLPQIYVVTVGESDYTRLTNFSSSRTGDTELWTMNADGSKQVQLTDRSDIDIDPSWSPDGLNIVYSRRIDASWDLAMIAATGGEPVVLTSAEGTEVHPRWFRSEDPDPSDDGR